MKILVRKLTFLGILAVGLFAVGFDSTQASAATASKCSECSQMADTCRAEYEEGEPGYNWCMKKVENCFRFCRN